MPIVFRQEGVPTETAGQFEEHEIARMVAPLLFSFADSDGSPTVVARVGAGVIPNGQPQVYFIYKQKLCVTVKYKQKLLLKIYFFK